MLTNFSIRKSVLPFAVVLALMTPRNAHGLKHYVIGGESISWMEAGQAQGIEPASPSLSSLYFGPEDNIAPSSAERGGGGILSGVSGGEFGGSTAILQEQRAMFDGVDTTAFVLGTTSKASRNQVLLDLGGLFSGGPNSVLYPSGISLPRGALF